MSEVIEISQIKVDMSINTIPALDETLVEEYKTDMLNYGIGIWQDEWEGDIKVSKTLYLWSGFHTVEAAKRAFGETHEVRVDIHGEDRNAAYLLATGENAHRGRRRNNTEKRNAVQRWLLDEKGKLWTNNHIAKQCHCSADLVTAVAKEITTDSASEIYDPNYQRPTLLKFYNRYRDESEIETQEIGSKSKGKKLEIDPDEQLLKAIKAFCKRLSYRVSDHKFFVEPNIKDYVVTYCADKGIGYYYNDGEYETACLNPVQREEIIKRLNTGYYEDFARRVFAQTLLRTGEKEKFPEYMDDSEPMNEDDVKDELIDQYRYDHEFTDENVDIPDLATSASITQSRVRELMATVKSEYAISITELEIAIAECTEALTNPEIHYDEETALTLIGTATSVEIRPLFEIYTNSELEIKEYRLDIENIQDWTKRYAKIATNLKAKELDYIKALYGQPQEIWIRAVLEVGTGEQDDPVFAHTQISEPVILISALDLKNKKTLEMWDRMAKRLKEKIKDTLQWTERGNNIVIKPKENNDN